MGPQWLGELANYPPALLLIYLFRYHVSGKGKLARPSSPIKSVINLSIYLFLVFFEKKGKTSRNSSTSSAGQSGQSTSSGISGNGSASSGYGSSRHSPSFFASSNQNSTLGRPPSRSYQKRVSIEPIEEHPTVTSYTLSELLAQAELSQYLHAFQNNLGGNAIYFLRSFTDLN